MKTLIVTIALVLSTLVLYAQSKNPIVIGYHIGNTNEILGMALYAKKHHLHLIKIESVNNMVLCYYSKSLK
jgi:hypothetical protein